MCREYVKSEGRTIRCCLSVCVLLEYIIIAFFKMLYGEEYSYVVARCIFKEILVNISERNVFLIYRLLGRLIIAENIPCSMVCCKTLLKCAFIFDQTLLKFFLL